MTEVTLHGVVSPEASAAKQHLLSSVAEVERRGSLRLSGGGAANAQADALPWGSEGMRVGGDYGQL